MKILIVRLSAIGDIFFCTSLLPVLKRRYGDCHITWLSEPVGASIIDGHPLVDSVITLPRRDFDKALKSGHLFQFWKMVREMAGRLREQEFDLVIDPQGLLKSGVWGRIASAGYRVGVGAHDGSSCLYDRVVRYEKPDNSPILVEYRELARLMGDDPGKVAMDLHVKPAHAEAASAFLQQKGLAQPVILCPFTTRPQKHWFDESWAELGDRIQASGLGRPVILGGPADGDHATRIASMMKDPAVIAAGEPRPIGFALALIRLSNALVGVDTGLTHAGIAFGCPTVCLFGSTRPYVDTRRANAKVLFHDLECAPCRRHPTCNGRFDCMRMHEPAVVLETLQELISVPS